MQVDDEANIDRDSHFVTVECDSYRHQINNEERRKEKAFLERQ